jgi:Tol biopolymer transport system component
VLVPASAFRDLASPRYSPQGDRLAFMAPASFVGHPAPALLVSSLFITAVASAHGVPWDVWLVGADGSNLRLLAQLGADDGTVCWSPDGSQLFVYGGAGSFLVDASSGEVTQLGYVAGYGSTAWLPG